MHIDLHHVRAMLGAMGYQCEPLNHLAITPTPVLEAVRSAWESVLRGDLQAWEIEMIATRMHQAVSANARAWPDSRNNPV